MHKLRPIEDMFSKKFVSWYEFLVLFVLNLGISVVRKLSKQLAQPTYDWNIFSSFQVLVSSQVWFPPSRASVSSTAGLDFERLTLLGPVLGTTTLSYNTDQPSVGNGFIHLLMSFVAKFLTFIFYKQVSDEKISHCDWEDHFLEHKFQER